MNKNLNNYNLDTNSNNKGKNIKRTNQNTISNIENRIKTNNSHGICHPGKAHHPDELKNKMITRLKKIEGQIRGIAKMVENDVYCDDILHQFSSVEAALKGVKTILLEAHMKTCVIDQIKSGHEEVIEELLITIKKMLK